jgi:membrane associated rhomboid family serine protease
MNNYYRPSGFLGMPPVIKNLVIINILFFLATIVLGSKLGIDLIDKLGLHYPLSEKFAFYQVFTHILFNMFGLWMFGMQVEQNWGTKRFLIYYLVAGLGAALTHYTVVYFEMRPLVEAIDGFLMNPNIETLAYFHGKFGIPVALSEPIDPAFLQSQIDLAYQTKVNLYNQPVVVGASGAVYGVLLAFGMMFPNHMVMMLIPPIPIKAKYFVLGLGLLALISTKADNSSNIAHAAHLGGMVFGYLLIRIWNRKTNRPLYFG